MKFRKRFTATFITALLLLTAIPYVNAAQIQPQTLLDADDNFGSSVAVFGEWAMVGAYGDDSFAGKVYVFRNDGTTWGPAAQSYFTPLRFSANDYFGRAVDMFGDMAVVGADGTDIDPFPRDPTSKLISNAGAAYIFELDGSGVWRQAADLTAYDPNANTYYGSSVGASSRYVIVGAPGAYGDAGAAYIYERPSTGWSDVLIEEDATRIMAPVRAIHDYFGASVAVSDEFAAAGAYGDDQNGNRAGALYVFQRSGDGSWEPHVKLPNGAVNPHNFVFQSEDKLGMSAAIDGDFIIAGAPGISTGTGKAYIFHYDGGQWTVTDELQEPGVLGFGTSVAIKGNYAAVGTEDGPAFIYRKSGAGNWERDDVNTPFGPADGNGSVSEVDISAAGGVYEFIGGMPARNSSRGAAFIDDQEVSAPDDDNQPNVPPKIYAIDDQVLRIEDATPLNLVISDLETPDNELTTRAEMTSDNLTEGVDISFRFSDADPAVLIIESLSTTKGTADFTVTVEDQCTANMDPATCPKSDAAAFRLTVADIPGIDISEETPAPYIIDEILEGQPADPIVVKFRVDSPESMQNLDVTSSNEAVIPDANLKLSLVQSTEAFKEYRLEIMPNEQAFGRAQITISATTFDGIIVNETFLVTINSFPWVEDFPTTRTEIKQDAAYILNVPFSVHDVETPASELQVLVESYTDAGGIMSAEPGVKPVESTDNNRVLEIPLKAGAVGEIALSLSVSDEYSAKTPFQFTLKVVHSTDTVITGIWEQGSTENLLDLDLADRTVAMNFGDGVKSMTIGISDGDDAIDDITKPVSSTRTWASGLELFNCFENNENPPFYECTLSIDEPTASADTSLDARITITVSDGDPGTEGDQQSFFLTYNTPPTIEPETGETFFDGVVIDEDSDAQVYRFVIGDDSIESVNDYGRLEKAISANSNEFLDLTEDGAGIYPFPGCADEDDVNCWECTGGDCQIRIKPTLNDFGTSRIAIRITDIYGLPTRRTFNMTVDPVNDPPELTVPAPFAMDEDQSRIVDLVLRDVDGDQLTLTIASLNAELVPNAFKNLKICEETGTVDDPSCPENPADPGWYGATEPYILTPAAADDYRSTVKLFIQPTSDANTELFGAGVIEASVADAAETDAKTLNFTVNPVADSPVLQPPSLKRMEDDRNRETAEGDPAVLEIRHPDGEREMTIRVELPEGDDGSGRAIPLDAQHVYFIDSAGRITNSLSISETSQPGETLSLGLVLFPRPNVIETTTVEEFNLIIEDVASSLSTSQIIKADISPVNDLPTFIGLEPAYPCIGCQPEPPWLQDEQKTIRFYVDDPDPHDPPGSLKVTAGWGGGIDPTGAFTPPSPPVSDDGRVDLVVRPPDLVSGALPLTITVSDGESQYSQDATINIEAVNYPPVIQTDPVPGLLERSAKEGQPIDVELRISDIETEDLSTLRLLKEWRSISPPDMPNGTFSGGLIDSDGFAVLTILPPADWPRGTDKTATAEIVVAVQEPDGTRSEEPVILSLVIEDVPSPPRITPVRPLPEEPSTIREGGTYALDFQVEDVDTLINNVTVETGYDPGTTGLTLDLSTSCQPAPNDPENDYKKQCTLTVKGASQSFGEATLIITARDDGFLEDALEVPLVVQEVDDPPSFRVENPPIVTQENDPVTVSYVIEDPDTLEAGLQVVSGSLRWAWKETTTPTAPVGLELVEHGKYIIITPTQNGYGLGAVSLQVTDGTNTVSAGFDVRIEFVNNPPHLEFTNPPQAPVDEKTIIDLNFTVSDVETASEALEPTYVVEWLEDAKKTILDNRDHLLEIGTGAERTLRFTPPVMCSRSGALATIKATVWDKDDADPQKGSDQVTIEYLAQDHPPLITKQNGLYVEEIQENSGQHYVDFVVSSDPQCRPATLVITAPVIAGENPELLPQGSYFYHPDYTDAVRRLVMNPAQNTAGAATVTVSVVDASTEQQLESDPLTFTLRVAPVPHPPTISTLMQEGSPDHVSQIVIDEGGTTENMGYVVEVDDLDTPLDELIMGAAWAPVSGREDDFVEGEIRFEGTGSVRTVIVAPDDYDSGYARITPWVKDSPEAAPVKSQPFQLWVRPINNPPIINAPIADPNNIVYAQWDEEYVLHFEVRDVDTPLHQVIVSAASGNNALLPQTDSSRFDWDRIIDPQDNMTHWLKMKPLPSGGSEPVDVPVAIRAGDGDAQSEFTFTLRVVPDVTPPQINIRSAVDIWEDASEDTLVNFWVWDETKAPADLDVFVFSGDVRYIPNSLISVAPIPGSGPGDSVNWRMTFRPAENAPFDQEQYTVPLVVRVSNDFFGVDAELSVTIHNRNDAPEISAIPDQNARLNEPVEVFFTVDDIDEGPDALKLTATADPSVADFEFSPDFGRNRSLKVFPKVVSDDQRTLQVAVRVTDNSGVVNPDSGEEKNHAETTFTIHMEGVLPGDADGDGVVGIGDAVTALQVLAGIEPMNCFVGADIDGDGRIGFAEALNALRKAGSQ